MPLRGAYIDPKGVRWDPNDADYEGFLTKKSKWMGEWRKRYLILKGSKLFFAKNGETAPHGMIDLVDCLAVKGAEIKSKKSNALEIILKNETFLLFASTEREKDEWLGRIGKSMVKYSNIFVPEEYEDDETDSQNISGNTYE